MKTYHTNVKSILSHNILTMFSSTNNKQFVYILILNFILTFTFGNPSDNILANFAEKLTALKNCLVISNIFSDTTKDSNFATFPQHFPRGRNQTTLWQDFLSHLISISGKSTWIIENENSRQTLHFSTIFSTEVLTSWDDGFKYPRINPIGVPSNLKHLNRGISTCAVTIFLNYISDADVAAKRIFLEERNPFVLRGTANCGTVLILAFELPQYVRHGIVKDLVGSGRVFRLHVAPILVQQKAAHRERTVENVVLKERKLSAIHRSIGIKKKFVHSQISNLTKTSSISRKMSKSNPEAPMEYNFGRWNGPVHFSFYFLCQLCPPWYFLIVPTSQLIQIVEDQSKLKSLHVPINLLQVRPSWNLDVIKFHTNVKLELSRENGIEERQVVKLCAESMKLKKSYVCSMNSRKLATLANVVNVSFISVKDPRGGIWGDVRFTEFMLDPLGDFLNRMSYQYEQG